MNQPTLHHIYDPLCGWCYAVAPLVRAAREVLPAELARLPLFEVDFGYFEGVSVRKRLICKGSWVQKGV
jgi:hypothetical protein